MTCDFTDFTAKRFENLATQYRESPNLRALIANYLGSLVEPGQAICAFDFDIDTVTGSNLTVLGNVLGFSRVHCSGQRVPVFGFECPDDCYNTSTFVGGFCDVWLGDCDPGYGSFEFTDDDLYRGFLKSLVIRYDNDFSRDALVESLQVLFDPTADIMTESAGTVNVFTGRALTPTERSIAHLYAQVIPVAPGVQVRLYETTNGAPFGFGAGWGELCTSDFPALVY